MDTQAINGMRLCCEEWL